MVAWKVTYLVAVGTEAEVLDGLTGVLGATEDEGVATGGGAEGKLVEGDGLTTGGEDAGTGGGGEAEGSNGHLGEGEHAVVIGDGADDDDGALLLLGGVGHNAGEGDWGPVDLGHKQAAEDDLVEGRVGTAWMRVSVAACKGESVQGGFKNVRARKR